MARQGTFDGTNSRVHSIVLDYLHADSQKEQAGIIKHTIGNHAALMSMVAIDPPKAASMAFKMMGMKPPEEQGRLTGEVEEWYQASTPEEYRSFLSKVKEDMAKADLKTTLESI
jgi:uncharacterized protein (DUF305 family)